MPRSRNIKPSICQNEELAELSCRHRFLFAVLPCFADREGRLEDRPLRLKMQIFPADNCDMDELLQDLHGTSMVQRYEVNNHKYIQIVNFLRHQHPHQNEKDSEIPGPDETETNTEQAPEPHQSDPADSLNLIPDSLNPSPKVARSDDSLQAESEIVLTIPLIDKTEFDITAEQISDWQQDYPAVDVEQEVRKCRAWNKANPKNRKTRAGIMRHINAWLSKAQDRAPTGNANGTGRQDRRSSAASRQDEAAARQAAEFC